MKIVLAAILAFSASNTMAQQQQVLRKNLDTVLIDQKIRVVEMQEITFPIGQVAPKHLHPCPVVGYIKSGKAIFQIEGEKPMILQEGDSFYEPKNRKILHFDNASKDKPLTFIAIYLKEAKEENVQMVR